MWVLLLLTYIGGATTITQMPGFESDGSCTIAGYKFLETHLRTVERKALANAYAGFACVNLKNPS